MMIQESNLFPEIKIIKPCVYKDNRGHFIEVYNKKLYSNYGIDVDFVQDNYSYSLKSVLRGLHYQIQSPQGKLVTVIGGEVFDVMVDIRKGSPTFGKYFSIILSAQDFTQVYIPTGFAHGFCVLSDFAQFRYKCTDFYDQNGERGIIWNDPRINIKWPVENPILSEKDGNYPLLDSISPEDLFP
jgi:dTDP-4-dehydrorhamnose 3,5-epimerase